LKIKDTHGHMSNFYPSPILWGSKTWATSEHLFQAQKYRLDSVYTEVIRFATSAYEAAKLGRDRNYPILTNWDDIKDDCMRTILFLKYTQNFEIKRLLLDTGKAKLIEASPKDSYWGEGPDGKGQNKLGWILMEVRSVLKNSEMSYNFYIQNVAESCGML
jgi:ribA/ribD-fused uncharacterized protein